jgi:hypothetical protein
MPSQDLTSTRSLAELEGDAPFASRHIGPRAEEIDKMLAAVGRA